MSISPGPLEGAEVYDNRSEHVGTVQEVQESGFHITGFMVKLAPAAAKAHHVRPRVLEVPRDFLASTDGERLDLVVSLDELLKRR